MMSQSRRVFATALGAAGLGAVLSGCAPIIIGTAAVGVLVATDRRTSGAQLEDETIQLRAAGRRPEDVPAVRNTGEAQWLADLAVQLAQKRVVREELGLKADEEVSGDMLNLWLQEQRKQAIVVTDPDLLPAGSAARVGSTDIPLIELGTLLLRTAEDEERDRFVKQVVYLAALESAARKEGVQVTAADLDAAVKKHKDDAAKDPRYSGVTYENLLKAEGLSAQSIRDLRVFRGQILLDKLAQVGLVPA